ncbi:MAG: TetR/AcrR family transcriptional regulator [Desulfobacteraceae bacterium]|nr:TetR/AcrR family transcriptional regulator [Desulfobacteraceae bacterium]
MTVNTKKRGRPAGSKNKLTSPAIINRVKKLMRSEGKIPSIRKLAAALNVDAMAIYYYFSNKNELLEAVTVSLIKEIYEPMDEGNWQNELMLLCKSYLKLLKEHPGLLETLLTMKSEGPSEIFIQRFHIALQPLSLDATTLKSAVDLLADYLHGFALAMNCNPEDEHLNIDSVDGPLGFYITAIASDERRSTTPGLSGSC